MPQPGLPFRALLLCGATALIAAGCAGKKDIVFADDGGGMAGASGSGGSQGSGGDGNAAGGSAAGGSAAGGQAAGGDGSGGSSTGGMGGEPAAGPSGPNRLATVSGGSKMQSESYVLQLTTGESPGGNGTMKSAQYRLTTGVLSAAAGN